MISYICEKFPTIRNTVFIILGKRGSFWIATVFVLSVMASLADSAVALLIQFFLKSAGLLSQDVKMGLLSGFSNLSVWHVAMLLFFAGSLRTLSMAGLQLASNMSIKVVEMRLTALLVAMMLGVAPYQFLKSSWLNNALSFLIPRSGSFISQGLQLLSLLIQSLILTMIMFRLLPWETLLVLFLFFILSIIMYLINQKNRKISARIPVINQQFHNNLQRVTSNWLLIRAFNTEPFEFYKTLKAIGHQGVDSQKVYILQALISALPPFLGVVMIVTVFYMSTEVFQSNPLYLVSFVYLLIRLAQSLGSMANVIASLTHFYAPFKVINDFLLDYDFDYLRKLASFSDGFSAFQRRRHYGLDLDHLKPRRELKSTQKKPIPPTIALQSMTFSYGPESDPIFDKLSKTVPAGSTLGLVGPSGCGKSTLLNLILGVLEPSSGSVLLDGLKPREYFAHGQHRSAYVGPDAFLIAGSILDNVQYGLNEPVDEKRLIEVLKLCECYEFIFNLPDKWHHQISEIGEGLSAGQKQRIAIARAILREPSLLILDEPTSNLDDKTEAEIVKTIGRLRGHCTIIIATHRKAILSVCDEVMDFEVLKT